MYYDDMLPSQPPVVWAYPGFVKISNDNLTLTHTYI